MNPKRKSSVSSDENLYPVEIKRPKFFKNVKSNNSGGQSPTSQQTILKESNFSGMIESDESCSNTSLHNNQNNDTSASDENSNEQTPSVSALALIHSKFRASSDYLDETLVSDSNNSFSEANVTQKFNASLVSELPSVERSKNKKIYSIGSNKGRSPLATVCNNNNLKTDQQKSSLLIHTSNLNNTLIPNNVNNMLTPAPHAADSHIQLQQLKQKPVQQTTINCTGRSFEPNENFFLYREQQVCQVPKDPFEKLSDEIILQIFKWLPKKTLIRCSFVCLRFNRLSQDDSLWTRLDLGNKTLKSGALGNIISRGVMILRLAQADIAHPIFDPERSDFFNEYESKLQYLDLSMANIKKPSLKALMSKCRQLKKLSLEHVPLNDAICDEIAKNTDLEALNLTMCEGLEQWSVAKMMKELQKLHSLNISWTLLSIESITALVQNLTPKILRLNIAGCRKNIFDSHVAVLSKRCRELVELDLSDCTGLTSVTIGTVCKFNELEYLSLSRCYGISTASYIELKNAKSLAYLDVFGILQESALITLQNAFPKVGINKFIHSSVARPTVGTRRTSIWGLRTRD